MTEFASVDLGRRGITTGKLPAVSVIPLVEWALTQDSCAIHWATPRACGKSGRWGDRQLLL